MWIKKDDGEDKDIEKIGKKENINWERMWYSTWV